MKKAHIKTDHELGITCYYCGNCHTDLDKVLKKYKYKIFLALLSGTASSKIKCPKCKKELDLSKLKLSVCLGPIRIKIKSVN